MVLGLQHCVLYTLPPNHLTEEQMVIISAAYKDWTVFYMVSQYCASR